MTCRKGSCRSTFIPPLYPQDSHWMRALIVFTLTFAPSATVPLNNSRIQKVTCSTLRRANSPISSWTERTFFPLFFFAVSRTFRTISLDMENSCMFKKESPHPLPGGEGERVRGPSNYAFSPRASITFDIPNPLNAFALINGAWGLIFLASLSIREGSTFIALTRSILLSTITSASLKI